MSRDINSTLPVFTHHAEEETPSHEEEVQAFLKRNPMPHIEIQLAADEYLQKTISQHLHETEIKEDRLFKINHYLSMIELALREAREKGADHLDLRKLEEGRTILNLLWNQLQQDYPELMGELKSPIPPSLDLSKVSKGQAERIIDEFRNAQQRDQRAIDSIARHLKLAADLNELIGKMTSEQAKHNPIRNIVRNFTVGVH